MNFMFFNFEKIKRFVKKIVFCLFLAFGLFLIILSLHYEDMFYFSLSVAVFSILFSFFYKNEKYWLPRTRAVLVNVGGWDYLRLATNRCDCERINLKDKYYVVEFGKREKRRDGITLRAVIEDSKEAEKTAKAEKSIEGVEKAGKPTENEDNIVAKVSLSGDNFEISGNVSILPRQRNLNGEFVYNRNIIRIERILHSHDLVFINDNENVPIAAFVFLLNNDVDDRIGTVTFEEVRNA